jgi:hypothetical protein
LRGRIQKIEDRRQKTEDRRQKSEDRRQKTEVRIQDSGTEFEGSVQFAPTAVDAGHSRNGEEGTGSVLRSLRLL